LEPAPAAAREGFHRVLVKPDPPGVAGPIDDEEPAEGECVTDTIGPEGSADQ